MWELTKVNYVSHSEYCLAHSQHYASRCYKHIRCIMAICDFICISLINNEVENFFIGSLNIWKVPTQSFCSYFTSIGHLYLSYYLLRGFYTLHISSMSDICIEKHLTFICWVFHSLNFFSWCIGHHHFNVMQFTNLSLYAFNLMFKKISPAAGS